MKKPTIGFIGQGWIGRNYADDFENRGYRVVRYALEKPYNSNKHLIPTCDIVFIAVPTPTTPKGFDSRIVDQAISLVGRGKIAVIKSTLIMGTARKLQARHPRQVVLHSPEFLSEKTAAYDAAHPSRNIIGLPKDTPPYRAAAQRVLKALPDSPYDLVCSSDQAEFIKYSHNVNGYIQVVFSNILYDLSHKLKIDWDMLKECFNADPFMSHRYLNPVHQSGRGAGGHCFIKDFEAFTRFFGQNMPDKAGLKVLESIRDKNVELLRSSKKDLDLLEGVYGKAGASRAKASRSRPKSPYRS